MSKIVSLQAGLDRAEGRAAPPGAPTPAPARVLTLQPPVARTPSREKRVHMGAYLPEEFRRSVRLVQAQTGEGIQTLLGRALNDIFRAHTVPVIDPE